MTDDTQIAAFVRACHRVAEHGLVNCSSGNLSWRVGQGLMLVTAAHAWLSHVTSEQVVCCRVSDGEGLGCARPSAEVGLHAGVLRARADVNVVLHFQAPYATTLACRGDETPVNYNVIPEIPYYMGAVAEVPYYRPGTRELAEAVTEAMAGHNVALLRNHGQVTVGQTFDGAIQNASFFELACRIIVQGRGSPAPLSRSAVAELQAMGSQGEGSA